MLYLQLFGGLSARLDHQPLSGRATQRKRLALLALLVATPRRAMSRAKLIGLLWPEADSEHARHQLTTSAYDLRKAIGPDILISTPEELRLSEGSVSSDLWEFENALRTGDREQAVSLYTGPFLDGVFLSDAPEFERWVDAERERLARSYAQTVESLADEREAGGDYRRASLWWQRLAAHDPYSSRVALRLMRSLVAAGDPGGALQHARAHSALLRRDLEVEPDTELVQLAAQLRSQRSDEQSRAGPSSPARAAIPPPAADLDEGTEPKRGTSPNVPDRSVADVDERRQVPPVPRVEGRWTPRPAALLLTGIGVILLGVAMWRGEWLARTKPGDAEQIMEARSVDPRAHELYLRGRTAWSERSREGLEQAVVYFRRAVEQDPTYAAAWAGLADAYVILGFLGLGPPAAMFPKGKAAALRALELDRSLAAAYAPLGEALVWERDWEGAERAFQRAIELDPSYATAHQWYGMLMVPLGRIEEAVEHTRRASELDPLSRQINNTYGMLLHYAGRSEEALRHYQQFIEAEPDSQWVRQNPWLLSNASRVYTAQGQYGEAIRLLEQALSVVPFHPRPLADLAYTYVSMGRPEEALAVFSRADTANPQYPYFRASVFASLGQRDSAFYWLDRVEEWGHSPMGELRMDPRMEPVRSDPRYPALLERLGLLASEPTSARP